MLSYFMLVWLRTNAFVEYMTILGLANYCHVSEYTKLRAEGYGNVYVAFLAEYYDNSFFVRLFVCPVCLSFWLGVLAVLSRGDIAAWTSAPLTLFFYLIFNKLL